MIVLFLVLFCVENIARKGAVKMDKSAMNKTEQAFETYRPIILSRVKLFTAHRTRANAAVGWDDLMQEASLWFITTMQTQGLEAARRHRLSLHHALYEAVDWLTRCISLIMHLQSKRRESLSRWNQLKVMFLRWRMGNT